MAGATSIYLGHFVDRYTILLRQIFGQEYFTFPLQTVELKVMSSAQ